MGKPKGKQLRRLPSWQFSHFLKESFIISCDLKRCLRSIALKACFLSPRCLIWVHCCECDLTIRSSLIKHDSDHITAYFWSFQCLRWAKKLCDVHCTACERLPQKSGWFRANRNSQQGWNTISLCFVMKCCLKWFARPCESKMHYRV